MRLLHISNYERVAHEVPILRSEETRLSIPGLLKKDKLSVDARVR